MNVIVINSELGGALVDATDEEGKIYSAFFPQEIFEDLISENPSSADIQTWIHKNIQRVENAIFAANKGQAVNSDFRSVVPKGEK